MNRPNSRTAHIVLRNRAAAVRERGVALITTLMLLALLGAASVAITLLVSSDTMINGYYRSYRGSFYAADSGVSIISEEIKNTIDAAANTGTTYQLGTAGAVPASVATALAPFETNFTKIGDSGSWNSQFKLISATISTATTLNGAAAYCSADTPADLTANINVTCNYVYPFDVTVQGISSGNENEEIEEKGTIVYSSFSGAPATTGLPSFAKWGAFITNFPGCSTDPGGLVPGTVNGPSFTDTSWDFGNFSNPGYTFNGSIGQVGAQPNWVSGSGGSYSCKAASSAPSGFTAPKYNAGTLAVSQATITPPSDSYSQAQAVLDGVGGETTAAAFQAEASGELKTLSGTTYAASGTPANGVYIPTYMNGATAEYGTTGGGAAGGFYVQGAASVALSATTDSSGNITQTYAITQGSTTTTIVVDVAKNTTTVSTGSGHSLVSETLTGVPQQTGVTSDDPSGSAVNPTMVYVNGDITGLSGTVQNNTGITITSADNVEITGNLTYASSPVNTTTDTLVSNTNAGVLGIYTTGNIDLNPSSGSSLTVDASMAALSGKTDGTGVSGFCTSGNEDGCSADQSNITWTILGGRAEDEAHSVNISSSTTIYDQRFASGTFGPPWFPTAQPQAGTPSTPSTASVTVARSSWAELNRP